MILSYDKLACYLHVSLFFLFGTMIEFAIPLVLNRKCEDEDNKVHVVENANGKVKYFLRLRKQWRQRKIQNKITSNTVYIAASILFPSSNAR